MVGRPEIPDYVKDDIMTEVGKKYLPYGRQCLDEDDIQAVVDVLRGDWLTTGPTVGKFEDKFQTVVKSEYVVSCSSGTAALHLAYMALGIKSGDRIIVPAISFIATANAAVFCGADVLFADVDPETGLMRAEDVLNLVESLSQEELNSVAAITPVNLSGEVAEIEKIYDIAQQYGWKIIIDSCHAVGTSYRDSHGELRTVGDCHFAHMEVFSFHPVKTIAMGEGGAVTTNDVKLYEELCLFRNHGIERRPEKWNAGWDEGAPPPPWYYEMQRLGYNYRQSDIHSALGISQLNKLPLFIEKRQRLVSKYDQVLAQFSPDIRPVKSVQGCSAVRHLYVVLIDFTTLGLTRTAVVSELAARNIGTQVHYIPIYSQPFYSEKYGKITRSGAEKYYAQALSLPLHVSMTDADVDYVVGQLHDVIKGKPAV